LREVIQSIARATPAISVVEAIDARPPPGAQRIDAGQELPWGWPVAARKAPDVHVAYLATGLAPEGSGGMHSIVQEARGLVALGAQARVCVPAGALDRARRLYGDELFGAYASERRIAEVAGEATVAVATEHTSIALLARLARERPDLALAYYVQDYEPLFAELSSSRSDRALLSYGAVPGARLFAKTHFVRNVLGARHGVHVAKVPPSLDRAVFHADGPPRGDQSLIVTAMVRPRTPRRRPRATLASLMLIKSALGDDVQIVTFGCTAEELAQLSGSRADALTHLGRLRPDEVADQLRRSDVFIDGSAYQAFGRTGLEAMACGALPIVPSFGGAAEYAAHGRNAVVLDDDSPHSIADAVITLAGDEARLRQLRDEGIRTASAFSIERAARAQLGLFASLRATRGGVLHTD
jgi:hypothetical protein